LETVIVGAARRDDGLAGNLGPNNPCPPPTSSPTQVALIQTLKLFVI
jgi:hypothetical protein